jgi:hypothetical protein
MFKINAFGKLNTLKLPFCFFINKKIAIPFLS